MTGTYKTYEVFSSKSIEKCRGVIWRGLFNNTEGEGNKKRYFVYINLQGLVRITKQHPKMTIIESER